MSPLPTRPLGDSGLDVSVLGLGANNFGRRVDLTGTRRVIAGATGPEQVQANAAAGGWIPSDFRSGRARGPARRLSEP